MIESRFISKLQNSVRKHERKINNNSLRYFRRYFELNLSTIVGSNTSVMHNEPIVSDALERVGAIMNNEPIV